MSASDPQHVLDDTLPPAQASVEGLNTAAVRLAARRKLFGSVRDGIDALHLERFTILESVGSGGMGRVFAAYDPELDRKIAIKVLHQGIAQTQGRAAIVREAQAMARLDHPNVVSVYDVGTVDDHVFLAMEFVDGCTLGQWLTERSRSVDRIVAVLSDAGRGLAAAHAAGLVHRDFKPDNILISGLGEGELRARVSDFGLARAVQDAEETPGDPSEGDGPSSARTAIAGTPAYMAPEQHLGEAVGPQADQFSFCVVLFEALTGRRPYEADSYREIRARALSGDYDLAPLQTLPRHVRNALVRGLARRPEDRWPNLRAVLTELGRDPDVVRRRALFGGILFTVSLAAWVGWQREPGELCEIEPDRLGRAWDPSRKAEVAQAFEATGVAYWDSAWQQVSSSIDAWTEAWLRNRRDACLATRARGEASEALLDRRMRCLDRKRVELEALTRVLAEVEATSIQRMAEVSEGLPDLSTCAEQMPGELPSPASGDQAAVDEVRADLATVEALKTTGRYREGLELAKQSVQAAMSLEYRPLVAEALLRRGRLEQRSGAAGAAEDTLEEALFLAEAIGHDEVSLAATLELTFTVGERLRRLEDGLRWARLADARIERMDRRGTTAQAELHSTLGAIYSVQGRLEEARREAQRSLELSRQLEGDEATAVAVDLHNLGLLDKDVGDLDAAQAHLEQARAIFEKAYGPEHPYVAGTINSLGLVAYHRGDYARASALHRRALRTAERAHGPAHHLVNEALNGLANAAERSGDLDKAEQYHSRNLQLIEDKFGPEDVQVGIVLINLGNVYLRRERHTSALPAYERAEAILTAAFGAEHPVIQHAIAGKGRALHELGQRQRAEAELERAWAAVDDGNAVDDLLRGQVAFALARVVLEGGDAERAVKLARRARDALDRSANASQDDLREVAAWLEAHEPVSERG